MYHYLIKNTLVEVFHYRREQIFDHAAFAGFDFRRHAHAGFELNNLPVRLNLIIKQSQTGIKYQPKLFVLYRITRDITDFAFDYAVFGKREAVDFDFHILFRPHKADVFVPEPDS